MVDCLTNSERYQYAIAIQLEMPTQVTVQLGES